MSDPNQPLIIPIAHYVGQFFSSADGKITYNLRGGWGIVKLTNAERIVWAFAHGVPEQINDGRRWTRKAVLESAAPHVEGADPEAILNDLISREILVEVTPGTDQAIKFANDYRLVPLQAGFGNSPEEPWSWRIGLGNTVLTTVTGTLYSTWIWAHLYRSLWDACRKQAKFNAQDTELPASPEEKDPAAILTEVLEGVHHLLASGSTYIDVPFDWGTP